MKIALIGPLKPIRGGISHSNEILFRNLSKNNEIIAFSFKRLFPKIFYPGKFTKEKEEKTQNQIIDSINPINWFNTTKKINDSKPEIIIFQWWTTFLAPCYLWFTTFCKGKKIVVCQNVLPHQEGKFKRLKNSINKILTKITLSRMDRLVAMSNSDKQKLLEMFPNKEIGIYLEPIYSPAEKIEKPSKTLAKKKLRLENKKIVLFFGFVREYKGLKYLLMAMPEIVKECEAHLLIVGEFWEDKKQYLKKIKELGVEKNVSIIDSYVPDEEIPTYFTAADIIALPYIDISESGVIRLAFGFDLPIIATKVGGNLDHIEDNYNGFLVEPKNPKQIAEKITKFFKQKMQNKMRKAMRQKKKELEWSKEKEKEVLGNVK